MEDDIDAMRVQLVQHPLGTGVPRRGVIRGNRLREEELRGLGEDKLEYSRRIILEFF